MPALRKASLTLFAAGLAWPSAAASRPEWRGRLPAGAAVVGTARIASTVHPGRLLVLWMADAEERVSPIEPDEPYTCPDETRGSAWLEGRASVSLVDVGRQEIVDTIAIGSPLDAAGDRIDLPLSIRPGVYRVRNAKPEGRPEIVRLRDWNGDGLPHEFTLYQTETCSLTFGTLVGYSEARDRLVWYGVELTVAEGGARRTETLHWVDGLFRGGVSRSARDAFTRGYPEERPKTRRFEIRYDRARGRFVGTETITPGAP